jgi:hypothetical protein
LSKGFNSAYSTSFCSLMSTIVSRNPWVLLSVLLSMSEYEQVPFGGYASRFANFLRCLLSPHKATLPFVKDHKKRWLATDVALGMNCLISTSPVRIYPKLLLLHEPEAISGESTASWMRKIESNLAARPNRGKEMP